MKPPIFIPYSKPDHVNYPFVVCIEWSLVFGVRSISLAQPATRFAEWLLDGTIKNVLNNGYTHVLFARNELDTALPRTMLQNMSPKELLKLFTQARLPNT